MKAILHGLTVHALITEIGMQMSQIIIIREKIVLRHRDVGRKMTNGMM